MFVLKIVAKVIPPRPTFFPYGMNNIDDRLTHNVKTAYKKGIYKTAIAAEKLIANRKNQSPQNGKKATLKEQNAIQKNEVRRAYNDLIRSTVGGNNNSNNKSEVDLKKLRKQMKYMKHPPLPLPTPSKVRILQNIAYYFFYIAFVLLTNVSITLYTSGWILSAYDIKSTTSTKYWYFKFTKVAWRGRTTNAKKVNQTWCC